MTTTYIYVLDSRCETEIDARTLASAIRAITRAWAIQRGQTIEDARGRTIYTFI